MNTQNQEGPEPAWRLENLENAVAGLAHDITNLCAVISGSTELILLQAEGMAGKTGERIAESARIIRETMETHSALIADLRSLTDNSGAGKKDLLDPHLLLRQTIAMMRGALGPGITVNTDFAPGHVRIKGNKGLLHNVFINLFLNGSKAMEGKGRIDVRTLILGTGNLWISFKDYGRGMDSETLQQVLRRRHSTKPDSGHGFGLRNVLETIQRHEGQIQIHSSPGKGTDVRILLPISQTPA